MSAVLVTVAEARGSTPREAGARMLVRAGCTEGTIGGGRLEWLAIERARVMLDSGPAEDRLEVPLGPDLGQCCGGRVRVHLRLVDDETLRDLEAEAAAERDRHPLVLLFGAGHVGKALARALAPLPLRLRWSDERAHEFPPAQGGVEVIVGDPLAALGATPDAAACLVVTHSHGLDFALCEAALRRDLAYVGLIGSRTKRRSFERGFRELGLDEARIARLVCPIGGGLRDKRPAVIAALTAAEVLRAVLARESAASAARAG